MATFFNLNIEENSAITAPGALNSLGLQADTYIAEPTITNGVVDVIRNLRFTGSDITDYISNKIPFCILKEYEILTNSSLTSLLYTLQGSGYTTEQLKGALTSFANTSVGGVVGNIGRAVGGVAADSVANIGGAAVGIGTLATGAELLPAANNAVNVKDFISTAINQLKQSLIDAEKLLTNNEQLPGSLKPYQGLYIRQPTGFKYILPYFTDIKKTIGNQFSSSDEGMLEGNFIGKGAKKLSSAVDAFVKTALFTTPGAYIEQPKFYNIGNDGPSYEVTFNLINTFDVEDIQRHYDFLFLLAFQNLPYRKDIARIRLPSIYSFTLPGEIFLPYAYISSMQVKFIGNRRTVKLQHPRDGKEVSTVVPDVYEISLTIKGLNPDVGNFMVNDYLLDIQSTLANDPRRYTSQPTAVSPAPGTPAPVQAPPVVQPTLIT